MAFKITQDHLYWRHSIDIRMISYECFILNLRHYLVPLPLAFLQAEWIPMLPDCTSTSINPPEPGGTRAPSRSPAISWWSERRTDSSMMILNGIRTCHVAKEVAAVLLWPPLRSNGQAIMFYFCGSNFQQSQIGCIPYFQCTHDVALVRI